MTGPEFVGFRVHAPEMSPLLNRLMHVPPTKGQEDLMREVRAFGEESPGA